MNIPWMRRDEGNEPTVEGLYCIRCHGDAGEYVDGHQVTPSYPDYTTIGHVRIDEGDGGIWIDSGWFTGDVDWEYDVIAWWGPIPLYDDRKDHMPRQRLRTDGTLDDEQHRALRATKLPCDVPFRGMRFGKGVSLYTLVSAAGRWRNEMLRLLRKYEPLPPVDLEEVRSVIEDETE